MARPWPEHPPDWVLTDLGKHSIDHTLDEHQSEGKGERLLLGSLPILSSCSKKAEEKAEMSILRLQPGL